MLKPQLKTFLTVCQCGSFSRAASQLFITPSAVIQQINTLEKDLDTVLFVRGSKGVVLTPGGEYLLRHGSELMRQSEIIRREVRTIANTENEICVGTSLLEKCRLLYNLWILFSEQEKEYEITMVNIDTGHLVPDRADLVESVNGSVPWTRDWRFLEICQVPFGFAFRNDHPLAKKRVLHLEDLRGCSVTSLNRGTSPQITDMLETLRANDIRLSFSGGVGSSMLWESSFNNEILVVPLCWGDLLINMTLRPCRWDKTIPYGIFYRPRPSQAAQKFLDFIRKSYEGVDLKDIFPAV